jgi:hypothetical protein
LALGGTAEAVPFPNYFNPAARLEAAPFQTS